MESLLPGLCANCSFCIHLCPITSWHLFCNTLIHTLYSYMLLIVSAIPSHFLILSLVQHNCSFLAFIFWQEKVQMQRCAFGWQGLCSKSLWSHSLLLKWLSQSYLPPLCEICEILCNQHTIFTKHRNLHLWHYYISDKYCWFIQRP